MIVSVTHESDRAQSLPDHGLFSERFCRSSRSEGEQIRQIAAVFQVQDSLEVLIAAAYGVGIELLAGDDGPDRGIQCVLCKCHGAIGDGVTRRLRYWPAVDSGVSGSGEALDPRIDAAPFSVEGRADRRG